MFIGSEFCSPFMVSRATNYAVCSSTEPASPQVSMACTATLTCFSANSQGGGAKVHASQCAQWLSQWGRLWLWHLSAEAVRCAGSNRWLKVQCMHMPRFCPTENLGQGAVAASEAKEGAGAAGAVWIECNRGAYMLCSSTTTSLGAVTALCRYRSVTEQELSMVEDKFEPFNSYISPARPQNKGDLDEQPLFAMKV